MSFSGFLVQLLNGLAAASSLFFVAAGLSLIFGVTRIVNFAHGSFFMAGIYIAYTIVEKQDATRQLLRFIEAEHTGEAGIVYCQSRKRVEEIAQMLAAER